MDTQLTLDQAIDGFILHASARHLSDQTVHTYKWILRKVSDHIGATATFSTLTVSDIEGFLAAQTNVTKKTLYHYHACLSSLYTWATSRPSTVHNVDDVPLPSDPTSTRLPSAGFQPSGP